MNFDKNLFIWDYINVDKEFHGKKIGTNNAIFVEKFARQLGFTRFSVADPNRSYWIKKLDYKIPQSFLLFIFLLIIIQIILGAFLSGLNGGLIYNTWPDMNGTFFPNDVLLLDLFTSESFYNTSIIQFLHRSTAYLLVILVMIINYLFIKEGVAIKNIILFDIALLIQILLGIITLISGVEIKYASLHQLGSIFVLTTYILLIYKNSRGFIKR